MRDNICLGIDLDGVVIDCYNYILEKGKEYLGNLDINYTGQEICTIFGVSEQIEDYFWKDHELDYTINAPIKSGFLETIKTLDKLEIPYYFITNRDLIDDVNIRKLLIEQWLHHLIGHPVNVHINTKGSKVEACKLYGINLFIDDTIRVIEDLANAGIDVIRFIEPYNNTCAIKDNIFPMNNWKEIHDFIISRNM